MKDAVPKCTRADAHEAIYLTEWIDSCVPFKPLLLESTPPQVLSPNQNSPKRIHPTVVLPSFLPENKETLSETLID
jgi:hypothetical protein